MRVEKKFQIFLVKKNRLSKHLNIALPGSQIWTLLLDDYVRIETTTTEKIDS